MFISLLFPLLRNLFILFCNTGDKTNIDIEFVGAVGFDAAHAPTETYEIGRQAILNLGVASEPPKFTNITTRADVRVFQDCLRKYAPFSIFLSLVLLKH